MESINKVEIQGTVSAVKLEDKTSRLSVCTSEIYTSKDGYAVVENSWHNVLVFNEDCKEIYSLEKGSKVHITGRLKQQRYVDKDGVSRQMTEVLAKEITILQ